MAIVLKLGRRAHRPTPWHLTVVHVCRACATEYQLERDDTRVVSSDVSQRCASSCPVCHANVITERTFARPIYPVGGRRHTDREEPS